MAESFWADPQLEPKRAYRWLFFFAGVPQWIVKKVSKPSFDVTDTTHDFLIHKFHYPGKVEWKEVKVTLADPVQPDSAATMQRVLEQSGYQYPLDPNTTATISKANAVGALGRCMIQQLGADGESIEEWTLVNAWVKDVSFGELDYSSDEMVNVELTIVYDWAELNSAARARAAGG